MDITPYVESLRHDLAAAAEAGGPEARAAAERLALALDPAVRLALMDALSQAAAEITAELPAGTVDVGSGVASRSSSSTYRPMPMRPLPRRPPRHPSRPPRRSSRSRRTTASPGSPCGSPSRSSTAPRSSPPRAATRSTAWIVNVVRTATRERAINVDVDLSSIPFLDAGRPPGRRGSKRMTGWV